MASPNIWIIQNDFEKLKIALSTIDKKSPNNFLYTNCISHFNFDNVIMSTKNFNSFLHCQDSNTYIIFMKDSFDKLKYTRGYLNKNNIQYHEISFKHEIEDVINRFPNSLYSHEKNSKEMWIVNSEESLTLLMEHILRKKVTGDFTFYPQLNSNIKLSYSNNSDEELKINKFSFEGVITIDEKIILLERTRDMSNIPIKSIFDRLNIKLNVVECNRPKFINIEDKRNRKFHDEYKSDKVNLLSKTYY